MPGRDRPTDSRSPADRDSFRGFDRTEGTTDTDSDGVPSYLDTDSDSDGRRDRDTDAYRGFGDTDSDRDGLADPDTRRDGGWRHPATPALPAPVKDDAVTLREYKGGKLESEMTTKVFAVYDGDVIDADGANGQLRRKVPRAGATPPTDGCTWTAK